MVLMNLLVVKVTLIRRFVWLIPIGEELCAAGLFLRIDCRVVGETDGLGDVAGAGTFGGGEVGFKGGCVRLGGC